MHGTPPAPPACLCLVALCCGRLTVRKCDSLCFFQSQWVDKVFLHRLLQLNVALLVATLAPGDTYLDDAADVAVVFQSLDAANHRGVVRVRPSNDDFLRPVALGPLPATAVSDTWLCTREPREPFAVPGATAGTALWS